MPKDGIFELPEIIQMLTSGQMRRMDFWIQNLDGKTYECKAYTINGVTQTIRIDIKEEQK